MPLLLALIALLHAANAWLPQRVSTRTLSKQVQRTSPCVLQSTTTADTAIATTDAQQDDDDDEYEYLEYDTLQETDYAGSEWLVGTVWEGRESSIDETWVRLGVTEKGKNLAVWGDNSEGSWAFDVATQFLSFSKENLFGKRIWACTADDYYFGQGTVRGWTYLQPASVLAQWQAKRLGVDPAEAGTAPWFEEADEETMD